MPFLKVKHKSKLTRSIAGVDWRPTNSTAWIDI